MVTTCGCLTGPDVGSAFFPKTCIREAEELSNFVRTILIALKELITEAVKISRFSYSQKLQMNENLGIFTLKG